MRIGLDQSAYWSAVAGKKQFKHAINWEWLNPLLTKEASILDYGCGTGRLAAEVAGQGYDVVGMDNADGMIRVAQETYPDLHFRHNNQAQIDLPAESLDLILLFTVLTCIPETNDQQALVNELTRLLKPGGFLYISDLLINNDERNQTRYQAYTGGPFGVFEHSEGTRLRHHTEAYLMDELLAAFSTEKVHPFSVITMNGNPSRAIQILAKKQA